MQEALKERCRIEKVNYNMTMMLLQKDEGAYALIDLMMISEVNPLTLK
ncbi:hypothetical protein ACSFXN_09360 [Planococcus sp. 1R117A]